MKQLKEIDILGKIHSVKYFDFEDAVQTTNHTGSINHHKQTIQIDTNAHKQYQSEVLLHEIIHGVSHALNLNLGEDDVYRLGTGLYQVLSSNGFLAEGDAPLTQG